jgi:arginine-tRNA-protein transferase
MDIAQSDEFLVFDQPEMCPYLPHQTARLPLRWPVNNLTREQLDERLAAGDRRSGFLLYRASCPTCSACEAIRVEVNRFRPNRTQRRVYRRGQRSFQVEVGPPKLDAERLRLFNTHRELRGLAADDDRVDERGYRAFLVDSCCETLELAFRVEGRLAAVAIFDRGRLALSAVYCYYDLDFSRLSPGVFSVLTQIRLCREWGLHFVYLGYYVAGSPHMNYKAQYQPHERLIDGEWTPFERT